MTTPRLDPVHFLLVDDLEENLVALEALLRRDGLVLLRARSGSEALEFLLTHDIALALIDIQMPGMNGFELAELMRGTDRTRRVPIIFVTAGSADRERRFRGYEAGAVDFIRKPIEPDVLKSKAEVFFELFRQRQEVANQRDELRAATERIARLLEESRMQAEALQEADRRKDEFLAMLAHELRNPLAPVQNAVEIMRLARNDSATAEEAREIVSRQVSHMSRLIEDLLDVARIARGKIQLRTEPCDLAEIVRQTADDYRATLVAAGISMELHLPDRPVTVTGDATRLAQVVGNLLHNARKFTPKDGSLRITVSTEVAEKMAVVTLRDSGAGMDAKILSCLFEPFSQADQTLDRGKGGLGLGLALVKGLVELHHGHVTADSAGLNQGSTFTIRVPLLPMAVVEPESPQANSAVAAGKGLRILVVEDNRDAAESLRLLLTLLGHQVEVVFDGRSGLEASRSLRPDMVVSDLGLPGEMDGYALAKSLKSGEVTRGIYLVALSGYGQDDDRRRARECGFDEYLVKPVQLSGLQKVVTAQQDRVRSPS
jgi:signal transduction histidine kinase